MIVLTSTSPSPPVSDTRLSSSSSSLSTSSSTSTSLTLRRRFSSCSISVGPTEKSKSSSLLSCSCCSSSCYTSSNKLKVTMAASPLPSPSSSAAPSSEKQNELLLSRTFLGEDLLSRLRKETDYGRLPVNVASAVEELYWNYRNAVLSSGSSHADEIVLSNMSDMLDCVLSDVEEPFIFQPYHKAIREPFDYYTFGQNYIRPLVDFGSSYVGNIAVFQEMEEKLKQGHNVVLMSNHQSEADPAVIALHLENTNSHLAENMIYVAGDRVITDPLCKPFSMGRNLLCVYSKKHMSDVPELVDMKKRANTRSLKEMALLLRGGSQIIWIAPSGGRDRPDPVTNEWSPAPFDISSVDNMRRLVKHAGVPGHIYPLSILCYDVMPPPPQVEKEIGEARLISFHGAGISVAPEINYHDVTRGGKNEDEVKSAYAQAVYDYVKEQYQVLKAAIHGKQGFGASTPTVSLSQPWKPC